MRTEPWDGFGGALEDKANVGCYRSACTAELRNLPLTNIPAYLEEQE